MIEALLQVDSTIQHRSANSTDDYGSPTTTTDSTTEVKCYLELSSGRQDDSDDRQKTARAEYLYVIPAGTSIDHTDRVVIGSTTYEVRGIPWQVYDAPTGTVHHIECTLVEVDG